ncbi:MAG: Snf7 family protein [Candidatus Bathyarchaeia archaeon]
MRVRWSSEDRSLWRKIEDKLKISNKPLKERIVKAIYNLQIQKDKLENTLNKLQRRDRQVFEKCIGAHLSNDRAHAVMYANECAEIRNMAKLIMSAQLSIERVILRLETVKEFGDIMAQLSPVIGIVSEVSKKLSGIVPEVSNELDKIHRILNQTVLETGVSTQGFDTPHVLSEEAQHIIEEASVIAEQKIKERFPELPKLGEPLGEGEISIATSSSIPTRTVNWINRRIDEEVYNYIVRNQGKISISKCALELRLSTDEVKNAIKRLREKGIIKVI